MKCVIVKFSALSKYSTLRRANGQVVPVSNFSADHYVGTAKRQEYAKLIRARRKVIQTLQAGLATLRQEAKAAAARYDVMIEAGDVVPFPAKRKRKPRRQRSVGL